MQRTTKCYEMKMRCWTIFDTPGQWSVGDHARHVAGPTPVHLFLLSFPIKVVVVRRYWKELNAQISCPLFSSMCEYKDSGKWDSERRNEGKRKGVETQNIQKTFYSCLLTQPKLAFKCAASAGKEKGSTAGGGRRRGSCIMRIVWQLTKATFVCAAAAAAVVA